MWAFGKEIWVNKKGRYVHIVADYSHLSAATVSICNLGIMGTRYVRDTPIPTDVTLNMSETMTVTVENIYAEIPIANTLIPHVRQAAGLELDWVSISEPTMVGSEILIDATAQAAGEYKLVLESYDAASPVGSALQTDEIVVVIVGFVAPSLSAEPEVVVLSPKKPSKWMLPTIDSGSSGLASEQVTMPASLASVTTYDENSRTFTFQGLPSDSALAG